MPTNDLHRECVELLAVLANTAACSWRPRNGADQDLAMAEFARCCEWIAQSRAHLATFVAQVQAFVAASEQLIGERVEGALPGEYLDSVLVMLRTKFAPGSP